MEKRLHVNSLGRHDVNVDDGREHAADLGNEFMAGWRKAVHAPVEQKHQILEHLESNQWDFSLSNRVDNPTNADSILNLADSERFDVGNLAALLEIFVENHAQAT